jgi:hypothetical protein
MKTKIIENTTESKYPKLMFCDNFIKKEYYTIVLFKNKTSGTVIDSNHPDYPIGYTDNYFDINEYEFFKDKIILSNE